MVKAASVSMRNSSERFRIEHFDYGNSVIAERMMLNWNTVSFLGVTVRSRFSFTETVIKLSSGYVCDCRAM